MAKPKRWYDREASLTVRVVPRDEDYETFSSQRYKHKRVVPGIWECLAYPLCDGPGIGLLVFLPPALWGLSLPVFDVVAVLSPLDKSHWALGLLVVPVMVPMTFSFFMVFGYVLHFLGHMLVSSTFGENDHPRWPDWHPSDIAEGISRWFWAAGVGLSIAVVPAAVYLARRHQELAWSDWVILVELAILGGGYASVALASSLLHENILAANPITVIASIIKLGWAIVLPSILAGLTLGYAAAGVWLLLYRMPTARMEALALWLYWIGLLYLAMVVMRVVGLTCHARALELHWFQRRPKWASRGLGRIYVNS